MMTLAGGTAELLTYQTLRLADLWRITRRDGTSLRFTSHNQVIEYGGLEYEPSGGFLPTDTRKEADLGERNQDFRGIVSSDRITLADLRAGRYHGAKVEHFVVDWRYPWVGALESDLFWVVRVNYDGQLWHADIVGQTRKLGKKIGDVFSRMCRWQLGEAFGVSGTPGCKVDVAAKSYFSVTVLSVTSRQVFRAEPTLIPDTLGDNYFNNGRVVWLSGANAGLEMQVLDYVESTREITLQLPMPATIAGGDAFNIEVGCDFTSTTCKAKFDNFLNYGGQLTLPGTDKNLETP